MDLEDYWPSQLLDEVIKQIKTGEYYGESKDAKVKILKKVKIIENLLNKTQSRNEGE